MYDAFFSIYRIKWSHLLCLTYAHKIRIVSSAVWLLRCFILFLLSRDCIAYYFISRRLCSAINVVILYFHSLLFFFCLRKIAVIWVSFSIQATSDHIHDDEISYCLIRWLGFIICFSIKQSFRFSAKWDFWIFSSVLALAHTVTLCVGCFVVTLFITCYCWQW